MAQTRRLPCDKHMFSEHSEAQTKAANSPFRSICALRIMAKTLFKRASESRRADGSARTCRFETFRVFNTPIFKNPTSTRGSNLGKITTTSRGDRQLQIAAKIAF
jgi:hypothetical protein